MSYMDFSSWPREQEQSFVVYEQRSNESQKKAYSLGGIIGGIALVIMLGIYIGVPPEHKDYSKNMNMDNLTKKSKKDAPAAAPAEKAPAPAPAAAPAEKPAAEAPAAPAAAPAEEKK